MHCYLQHSTETLGPLSKSLTASIHPASTYCLTTKFPGSTRFFVWFFFFRTALFTKEFSFQLSTLKYIHMYITANIYAIYELNHVLICFQRPFLQLFMYVHTYIHTDMHICGPWYYSFPHSLRSFTTYLTLRSLDSSVERSDGRMVGQLASLSTNDIGNMSVAQSIHRFGSDSSTTSTTTYRCNGNDNGSSNTTDYPKSRSACVPVCVCMQVLQLASYVAQFLHVIELCTGLDCFIAPQFHSVICVCVYAHVALATPSCRSAYIFSVSVVWV